MAVIDRVWRIVCNFGSKILFQGHPPNPEYVGDKFVTEGYFIPTADIRIVECGVCGGMGLIPHRDQIGMPDTVPCPNPLCTDGKLAQIPLTAEMLTEMAKGD